MPKTKNNIQDVERVEAQFAPIQVQNTAEVIDYPKNLIANELRRRIETGVYLPGESIPPSSRLMEMTGGAAKNTVRAAVEQLKKAGYLHALSGLSTVVRAKDKWNTTPEERGE